MINYGLKNVITEIVPFCADNGWSEELANNFQSDFAGEDKQGELAIAILEECAVADSGYVFC